MFPNGYNTPFYSTYNIPNMRMGAMTRLPVQARSGGLFSRLFNFTNGIRNINWQGLLNNTSRTLGVINQAIPVVKQIGPMYNNMKSMIRIASLFKDETDPKPNSNTSTIKNNNNNTVNEITKNINNEEQKENTIIKNNYSNSPSFFI